MKGIVDSNSNTIEQFEKMYCTLSEYIENNAPIFKDPVAHKNVGTAFEIRHKQLRKQLADIILETCMKVLSVPLIFLPLVLHGCVDWARKNNVTLITEEHMDIINDKRSKEKNKLFLNKVK